jgi:predicted DNA-binding protein with PD1-like motif
MLAPALWAVKRVRTFASRQTLRHLALGGKNQACHVLEIGCRHVLTWIAGGSVMGEFEKIHVFRVKPDQELLEAISAYCREHGITSGVVVGIIGSLKRARLNYLMDLPGKYDSVEYAGPLEIVCAQGSVALEGDQPIVHIHMQVSSQEACRGGHLAEATVFSTAEVVIGELDHQLHRQFDSYTGLKELQD